MRETSAAGEGPHPGSVPRGWMALAAAVLATAIAYASVRAVEVAFLPAENPVTVVRSAGSEILPRLVIAVYVGGAAAIGGFVLAGRDAGRCARWLARGVPVALAALAAAGALAP